MTDDFVYLCPPWYIRNTRILRNIEAFNEKYLHIGRGERPSGLRLTNEPLFVNRSGVL